MGNNMNIYENSAFGRSKAVTDILERMDQLIAIKNTIERIKITKKQYDILFNSLSESNIKRTTVLKWRGRILFNYEG